MFRVVCLEIFTFECFPLLLLRPKTPLLFPFPAGYAAIGK